MRRVVDELEKRGEVKRVVQVLQACVVALLVDATAVQRRTVDGVSLGVEYVESW